MSVSKNATDTCPMCWQKEGIKHGTMGCLMYQAMSAMVKHYYGAVTVNGNEMSVQVAVQSAYQEWSPQMDQGLAVWSARQAH